MQNFWKEIFGKKVQHNEEAYWIKNQCQQNPSMEKRQISEMEVAEVIRMTQNWKVPGRPNSKFLAEVTYSNTHIFSNSFQQTD